MSESEPRYECPVCLGIKLEKLRLQADLLLDFCSRCGGIWFDYGEVGALRTYRPRVLWQRVSAPEHPHLMRCHWCQASMNANAASCPACGWDKEIDCPTCGDVLTCDRKFQLDACQSCKGVWFDNADLARIWNGELEKCVGRGVPTRQQGASVGSGEVPLFVEVLCLDPIGAHLAVELALDAGGVAVQGAAELASHTPEAVGAVIEGGVELTSGVFEVIAEIIAGMLG